MARGMGSAPWRFLTLSRVLSLASPRGLRKKGTQNPDDDLLRVGWRSVSPFSVPFASAAGAPRPAPPALKLRASG